MTATGPDNSKARDVLDVRHHDEVRRVRVGDVAAILMTDGTVTLRGNRLINAEFSQLSKEDIEDLLVALDGVSNEAKSRPLTTDLRAVLVDKSHQLASDIYRLSSYEADIRIDVHPSVFYGVLGDLLQFRERYEFYRNTADVVEVSPYVIVGRKRTGR